MLAVSHFRNTTTTKDDRVVNEMESFTIGDFADFSGENLVDSIDFDDLFVGIDMDDGDLLPDLEMDPEILAEFSVSSGDESDVNNYSTTTTTPLLTLLEEEANSFIGNRHVEKGSSIYGAAASVNPIPKEISDKSKKSSGNSKNSQGKRKVKVDWTPELHRRFVQAVEQLGVDKAVPSRILELMGIDCLTRHNIASHLQKYRCHRRHLLAREAEAASWNQRSQMYSGTAGGGKRDMNPWLAPTMGFPPPPPPPMAHFRPLHVWGHPHVWPKHMSPSPSPPPAWPPAPPPAGPSFWNPHYQRVPNALTPGAPCYPAPTRFPALPVPGIPSSSMYKVGPGIGVLATFTGAGQPLPKPPCDFHPSKESVDAAIGDVLSNPWQPHPLGLKPPSVDGVLVELQRQGITKIPPSTCA